MDIAVKNNEKVLGLAPITASLLQKFDVSGPRYTSYPTADRFVEAFTEAAYKEALDQRRLRPINQPLSIYVHIPFCESLCFYCACNKIVTKRHERSREYLDYLKKEIDLHLDYLGQKQVVSQLHLGGGSPTFFSDAEIEELFNKLKEAFASAKVASEIEVYQGLHGWCVPDMPESNGKPLYNKLDAERAWSKLLALYKAGLG